MPIQIISPPLSRSLVRALSLALSLVCALSLLVLLVFIAQAPTFYQRLFVGWVGVWGFWAGPGLVWMGCGVFAAALLWGGRLLAACHQSSRAVSCCW